MVLIVHAICGGLAWGVVTPLAVVIARVGNNLAFLKNMRIPIHSVSGDVFLSSGEQLKILAESTKIRYTAVDHCSYWYCSHVRR